MMRQAADSMGDPMGKTILSALADAFEQAADRDLDQTADRQDPDLQDFDLQDLEIRPAQH